MNSQKENHISSTLARERGLPLENDAALFDAFKELKEEVLQKRPILREIIQKRGMKTLYEYAQDYFDVNVNPPIQQRQEELIATCRRIVAAQISTAIADRVAEQLARYYFVSTADHHGPICHPFFLSSNLLIAGIQQSNPHPESQYVIVFACSNVSIENSSFPRGLLFHSAAKKDGTLVRLPFFSSHERPPLIYTLRPYTEADMQQTKKVLQKKVRDGDALQNEADQIVALLDEIYCTPEIFSAGSFSEQITKTNYHLWNKFFKHDGPLSPNLIYIDLERVVVDLLLTYHLDSDTIIHRVLFDRSYDALIDAYFEGIHETFLRKEHLGTYFFWVIPAGSRYRLQLWRDGNALVSHDGTYRIPLEPDAIRNALRSKELIPSLMLDFMILSFYYGLKCLGGFSQVNYLTFMKNAYIKMQVDRGDYRNIEVCARAQTKELSGDITMAFLGGVSGGIVPATGLDLILHGTDPLLPFLMDIAKKITLEEALNPLMPEFYRIIYPETERSSRLLSVRARDISRLTHLDQKIQPCVSL